MSAARWEREARTFTRYILGQDAPAWIVERYVRAHGARPQLIAGTTFDRWQVWLAARHPALTLLLDGAGRFAAPRSVLRRKLILIIALVEIAPATHRWFDAAPGGLVRQGAHLAWRSGLLLLAVLIGLPVRAALRSVASILPANR